MLLFRKLLIRPSAWCASHDLSFFLTVPYAALSQVAYPAFGLMCFSRFKLFSHYCMLSCWVALTFLFLRYLSLWLFFLNAGFLIQVSIKLFSRTCPARLSPGGLKYYESLSTFFAYTAFLRSVFVCLYFRPKLFRVLVGSSGLEPPTSRLSGVRSNHLSYEPIFLSHYRMLFSRKLLIRPSAWCASHDFSFFSALCSYLGWIFLSLTRFLLVF